jgi:hypothetical protein
MKHSFINLCICVSLMRCTPALAERGDAVSAGSLARVPAALQRWIARAGDSGRPLVRPLQALRMAVGTVARVL